MFLYCGDNCYYLFNNKCFVFFVIWESDVIESINVMEIW